MDPKVSKMDITVIFKVVSYDEIDDVFLHGFNRYQLTEKIEYIENGEIKVKDDIFVNEWDDHKLRNLSRYLKDMTLIGKVIAAFANDKVVGITCVDGKIFFDEYMNMPLLHVSTEYRGQRIGKKLFEKIQVAAKEMGAQKLYISGHPDVNTQAFYRKAGCVLTKKINKELYDEEPCDIHLEKCL